jgi:hypothetical protein
MSDENPTSRRKLFPFCVYARVTPHYHVLFFSFLDVTLKKNKTASYHWYNSFKVTTYVK